jgi:hypothetical protein
MHLFLFKSSMKAKALSNLESMIEVLLLINYGIELNQ